MDKSGKGCQEFPSKIFCLTLKKNFVEEPFCGVLQGSSRSEKVHE